MLTNTLLSAFAASAEKNPQAVAEPEATDEFQAEVGGRRRLMLLPAVHGEKYVSAAQLLKMRLLSNSQAMLQVWQCSYFSGFVCEVFTAHLYMVQWSYLELWS